MKTFKKFNLYLLMGFAMMAALSSCQKEQLVEKDQLETTIGLSETSDDTASKKPYTPSQTNPICYNAGIKVDKDCDGSYELGWNEVAPSLNACWTQVFQMANQANNAGWCYEIPQGAENCQTIPCTSN